MAIDKERRNERNREYSKRYYDKNKDAIDAKNKAYANANKDRDLEKRRKYSREAKRRKTAKARAEKAVHSARQKDIEYMMTFIKYHNQNLRDRSASVPLQAFENFNEVLPGKN